jgi:hypothetical protein
LEGKWRLGNVHNFPAFVNATGLFADELSADHRELFSPALKSFDINVKDAFASAQRAAKDALYRHSSITTTGGAEFGLFRYRADKTNKGNRDEQRLSLCFTLSLTEYISSLSAYGDVARCVSGAREQCDESRNCQDYVINRHLNGRGLSLPAVVIEFANDCNSRRHNDRKEAQLFTYAWNNTLSLPKKSSMLSIGVSFVELQTAAPTFQVFGYYDFDGESCGVVPLTGIITASEISVANLFYAAVEFALGLEQALPSVDIELPFASGAAGMCQLDGNKTRVKVINYNAFFASPRYEIARNERRTHEHSMAMLPGCSHLSSGADLDIIMWPDIAGDHEPHHSKCVAACIEVLANAHEKGILHCDLHLGNFVFNEEVPNLSYIIDWDHARPSKEPGFYVAGWQMLPERHADAKAWQPIKVEHDRYSLSKVMELFTPVSTSASLAAQWTAVCQHAADVETPLRVVADEVRLLNNPLHMVDSERIIIVTGSPPRERAREPPLSKVVE